MTSNRDDVVQPGWLPAVGAGRRIRALAAAGWSLYEQARRAGLTSTVVWELAWDLREWASRTAVDAVKQLYAELEHLPGGSARARSLARRNGWPPPAAWNPAELDNPTAGPGDKGTRCCPLCGRAFAASPEVSHGRTT